MLVGLAAFFLLLALHPFTTYPASLLGLRKLRGRRLPLVEARPALPSFAICVPAYNEEDMIVAKAENMLALQRTVPSCQLLIYVDAATDRTVELLAPFKTRIDIVVGDARRGKSCGLNTLVERTNADILVFSDANVMLDAEALTEIGAHFEQPGTGCVCGHLKYGNAQDSVTATSGNLYWKLEERIKQLESDTIGIVGADGSLFAVRRSLYPEVPSDIIDDFYVSMKILLGGHAVVRAPEAFAFERTGSNEGQEFGRKVRISCQAFNVHRLLWAEIRRARASVLYGYVSHRLLKWLIIYNLTISGVFAVLALCEVLQLRLVALGVACLASAAVAAWRIGVPPSRQVASLLIALVGVGLGVLRSLRGDRFQTWTPMSAARDSTGP